MTLRIDTPAGALSVRKMLNQICPEADLQVADDGTVTTNPSDFCTSQEPRLLSCQCICDLIASRRIVSIRVKQDLSATGGGRTVSADWDDYSNGKGADATVDIENRNRYRQRRRDTFDWMDVPDWVILAHELCGHALPVTRGDHPEARPGKAGFSPDWHQQSEQIEDQIRQERGLALRGIDHGLKP